jgi:hypothetical protein
MSHILNAEKTEKGVRKIEQEICNTEYSAYRFDVWILASSVS